MINASPKSPPALNKDLQALDLRGFPTRLQHIVAIASTKKNHGRKVSYYILHPLSPTQLPMAHWPIRGPEKSEAFPLRYVSKSYLCRCCQTMFLTLSPMPWLCVTLPLKYSPSYRMYCA